MHAPERRKYPRITDNVPLKISSDDFDIVTETRNLSGAGAYCRVNKYLEPMTKLKIHLLLPVKSKKENSSKKISCEGIVARVESDPGKDSFNVAIYFSDILERDQKVIANYVSQATNSHMIGPRG